MIPSTFKISPLEATVLLWHVLHCEDASNDADRTVMEIASDIDSNRGFLSKGVFESALYCCNMEAEKGKFFHPLGHGFERFLDDVIPHLHLEFHRYYNTIYEVRKNGPKAQTTEG